MCGWDRELELHLRFQCAAARAFVGDLSIGCLTSQQHASVFQGRIYSENCTCRHTEIEVADPTVYLTQAQYTDTLPTSPSAHPITPGAWQGSHWSASFYVTGMTPPGKIPSQAGLESKLLSIIKRKPSYCKTEGYNPNQDALHQLARHQQTIIFRLRTGHCRLNSHLKRIGVKTSAQCPCGEADQTPKHYLQSCSLHQQARQQIWPTCVSLKTRL